MLDRKILRVARSRWLTAATAVAAVAFTASALTAQSNPSLLADIDPGVIDRSGSSDPAGFVQLGNLTLFHATDPIHGRELWVTDGTSGGTRLLADLFPGLNSALHAQTPLRVVGNQVLFAARLDGTHGLFRTDGTPAGTTLIRLVGSTWYDQPGWFHSDGQRLWFPGWQFGHGTELWVSDGTPAGTYEVTDLNPGHLDGLPFGASDSVMASLGTRLVFSADNGVHGNELFVTDGTAAGTSLLFDAFPGFSGAPNNLAVVQGRVVFAASPAFSQRLWYTTDGTTAGTIALGLEARSSWTNAFGYLGASLLLQGVTAAAGVELFLTDGTPTGTILLGDLRPGPLSSLPGNFTEWNGLAWFTANTDTHGVELWQTDGTPAGTRMAVDVWPGSQSGVRTALTPTTGGLVFGGDPGDGRGVEPFVSDGTPAGTMRLVDINQGPGSSRMDDRPLSALGQAWFAAEDPVAGREPWRSDGTPQGSRRILDIGNQTQGSSPSYGVSTGARGVFLADSPNEGIEPWRTDATPGSTSLWGDLTPGTSNPSALGFAPDGDIAWWSTRDLVFTTDLLGDDPVFVSDAGPFGTELVLFDRRMYFAKAFALELWSSDGSIAGTRQEWGPGFAFYPIPPRYLTVAGGQLWFLAGAANSPGGGVFSTDGTAGGVRLRIPLDFGFAGGTQNHLVAFGGGVLVLGSASGVGPGLWWTDGATTRQLATFATATASARLVPVGRAAAGDGPAGFLFVAADAGQDFEPWFTDGTAAGTQRLADIAPGATSSAPRDLTATVGGPAYFSADDDVHGRELWTTDGTPGGTRLVLDAVPGYVGLEPESLLALGDAHAVAFQGTDAFGAELWTSDGTAAGTRRRTDLNPRWRSAEATPLAVHGRWLLFGGDDGQRGIEPWSLPLAELGGHRAHTFGGGCARANGARPRADHLGAPVLGDATFAATVRDGRASSAGGLLIDFAIQPTRMPSGCVLWLSSAPIAFATTTDAAGTAQVALPIPVDPLLVGAAFFGQWILAEPQGQLAGVLAASDVLEVVVGR